MKDNKPSQNLFEQAVNEMVDGLSFQIHRVASVLTGKVTEAITDKIEGISSGKKFVHSSSVKQKRIKKLDVNNFTHLGYSYRSKEVRKYEDIPWGYHTLVVGASGSGKTSFIKVAMEGILHNDRSLVLIDPKGEIDFIRDYKAMCKTHNRKGYIFCEGYVGEGAVRLNPFKGKDYTDVITMFENCMFPTTSGPESYYLDKQRSAIGSIVRNLLKDGKEVGLWSIYHIFLKEYGDDENYEGLKNKLENFLFTSLGELLKEEGAKSIEEIIDEGANVFVAVNMQRHNSTGKLLCKFFVNELMKISGKRSSRGVNCEFARPVSAILDEAGSIIEPEFLELISKSRSSKIEVVACSQSFNDFERAFTGWSGEKSLWESISNYFVFRQLNEDYVELFAKIAGTQIAKKKTHQLNDGVRTGGASVREGHEFIIHPDEIRKLKQGECILVSKKPDGKNLSEHIMVKNISDSKQYNLGAESLDIVGLRDFKKEREESNKSPLSAGTVQRKKLLLAHEVPSEDFLEKMNRLKKIEEELWNNSEST